jgi:hypothetical protein
MMTSERISLCNSEGATSIEIGYALEDDELREANLLALAAAHYI